jgi:hypothetical protein
MQTNPDGKTADGMQRRAGLRSGPPRGRRGRHRSSYLVAPKTACEVVSMRDHLEALRIIRGRGAMTEVLRAFCNVGRPSHQRGAGPSQTA